jgi:hypothetical protein
MIIIIITYNRVFGFRDFLPIAWDKDSDVLVSSLLEVVDGELDSATGKSLIVPVAHGEVGPINDYVTKDDGSVGREGRARDGPANSSSSSSSLFSTRSRETITV